MKNKIFRNVLIVALPLLLSVIFLFQSNSRVEVNDCSEIIKLENGLHIPVSCDAWDYVEPAIKFQHLWWNPTHIKQSRPLHIITAHYLALIFKFAGVSEGLNIDKKDPVLHTNEYVSNRRVQIITEQWPIYFSYIVINLLFIVISLWILIKITNYHNHPLGIYLYVILSVTFVFNYLNKSFLYNIHSQVFALVAPLLTIYHVHLLLYEKEKYRRRFYLLCLGLGLLMLFYGSFIYVIPFLIFSELFVYGKSMYLRTKIQRWIFGLSLFVLPTLLYVMYLKIFQNVTYFNQEVGVNRQFFWALDVFTKDEYSISEFLIRFSEFIKTFEISNMFSFIVLLYLTFYYIFKKCTNNFTKLNILFAFYLLLFTYLNGAYKPRMTFVFCIPVLVASVFFIQDFVKTKKQMLTSKICLIFFISFWVIYHFNY